MSDTIDYNALWKKDKDILFHMILCAYFLRKSNGGDYISYKDAIQSDDEALVENMVIGKE